MNTVLLTGL